MKPLSDNEVILQVEELKVHFALSKTFFFSKHLGAIRAVDGLSFVIRRGETMGLVGESGCGKSTTGQAILQLYRPTAGRVKFQGVDLTQLNDRKMRIMRRKMQMIFQDNYASLNPRMTIGESLSEPLGVHQLATGKQKVKRIRELLEMVGIPPYFVQRYPHELSGGQLQRIGIARALAVEPEFIVCDEPVSALDVSIQAQIINLLEDLQNKLGLTYLFISHDLSVVRHISDRVAVMYLGKIVELANRADLYKRPIHPYTKALLSAVPIPDPKVEKLRERILLTGDVPSPAKPPSGCRFWTRCQNSTSICSQNEPEFKEIEEDHWVCCHFA
jgi:oligopeptide transport system ATP-binding protein